MQDITIVGGGFAGVWSALGAAAARRDARHPALRITLVSRDPYLTVRPRLYEARLDDVRLPLEPLLAPAGVDLIVGDVTRVDTTVRSIDVSRVSGIATHRYDRLIIAAGSRLRRPAVPGAVEHAFNVDTYAEAMRLHEHLAALPGGGAVDGRFTSVVVGAGLAGLEVATTMMRRLRDLSTLVGGPEPTVVLVERGDRVGQGLGSDAGAHVERALRELGVSVRVGSGVAEVTPGSVTLASGERIAAATTVWTGGLTASELTLQLPAERDSLGRAVVDEFLRVPSALEVLVAGDSARAMADADHVAPMSCQFAIPMGDLAGRNAVAELSGRAPRRFLPPPYVTCIDLGEWGGLFTEGWDRQVRLAGYWGAVMKQSINTRLIVPVALDPGAMAARDRRARPAA